jgi:hypothetical protein
MKHFRDLMGRLRTIEEGRGANRVVFTFVDGSKRPSTFHARNA